MKIATAAVLNLCLTGVNAQETVLSSGQEASGVGGFSSSSIGQLLYTTNEGSSGTVAQGVQQPFEISTTIGIDENEISLICTAYPNPTVNNLTLTVGSVINSNLSYQLMDIAGKTIESNTINSENTTIFMTDLPRATYFLKVTQGKSEMRTFKIIKN